MNANQIVLKAIMPHVTHPAEEVDFRKMILEVLTEINRRAESDIFKGNPVEGAHYRALCEVRKELEIP